MYLSDFGIERFRDLGNKGIEDLGILGILGF